MKHPSSERGFVMAAVLFFITATAVVLATVLPAYVMDSRRDAEDELIFRGAEYARAIKKFQNKYGALPLTTDELIKGSDGIPSLRRIYVDPINGGEFRPIYVNADGTLQGSNLYLTLRDARTNTDPSAANVADTLADDAAANNPNGAAGAGGAAPAAGAGAAGTGAANLNNQGASLNNTGANLQTNQGANLTNNRGTNLNTVGTGTGTAPAAPAAAATTPATTQTQQAGLVGVGSQADIGRDSVKKYVGQVRYVNWEFISNVSRTGRGAANAATGTTNTTGATGTAGAGATGGATGTNLNNTGTNLTTGGGATGGAAAGGAAARGGGGRGGN